MDDGIGHHASKDKVISSTPQDENDYRFGVEEDSDQQHQGPTFLSTPSWVVLCASMLLAEMQAALDSTITADLQPAIINTFGEISKFPWINVTYSLGMGGSCLLW